MRVQVLSFGHKYGNPGDMELLFRRQTPAESSLYCPELRPLSGHDKRVVKYLKEQPEVEETLKRFYDLLDYLLPQYQREGKSLCDCRNQLHRRTAPLRDDSQRAEPQIETCRFRCSGGSPRCEKIKPPSVNGISVSRRNFMSA